MNFLHIALITGTNPDHVQAMKFDFDVATNRNSLQKFSHGGLNVSIGMFGGREEAVLDLKDPASGAFVFIVEGAFEVENRLLQARDGMAIWNTEKIELEALSNDAVVVVIE